MLNYKKQLVGGALSLLTLFAPTLSTAKPATIVAANEFGSDPYQNIANIADIFVVTGDQEASSVLDIGSPIVDVLKFNNNEFEFVEAINFRDQFSDATRVRVQNVKAFNEVFVFHVYVDGVINFVVAKVENEALTVTNSFEVGSGTIHADITVGGGYLYISDLLGNDVVIRQFDINAQNELSQTSNLTLPSVTANSPGFEDRIIVKYANEQLVYLINNRQDKATVHRVSLNSDNELANAVELNYSDAKAIYTDMAVSGSNLYFSAGFDGVQVAEIQGDTISLSQEQSSFRADNFIFVNSDLLLGYGFSGIELFDIQNRQQITRLINYSTLGLPNDALLVNGNVFMTTDWAGVEALQITNSNIITLDQFRNSGEVTDFAIKGDTLVSSALNHAMNVWQVQEDNVSLTKRFELPGNSGQNNPIGGVEFHGDDLLAVTAPNVTQHRLEDIINGVDNGTVVGNLNLVASFSEIVSLPNGYLVHIGDALHFFDQNLQQKSRIDIDNPNFLASFLQKPLSHNNLLFVRVNNNPNQVIIYDTQDLDNVTKVAEFTLSNGRNKSNMVIKDDVLYLTERGNNSNSNIVVSRYNISDLDNITELSEIETTLNTIDTNVFVWENFLLVMADKGLLYDISDLSNPTLIDENPQLASNGLSIGRDREFFNVLIDSAGRIQRSMINLAPTHDNLAITTNEDTAVETTLTPKDDEGDSVSYQIVTNPESGQLEIVENQRVVFTPNDNVNGNQEAKLSITDQHGGSSEFTISYNVEAVNDLPEIAEQTLTTDEDTPLVTTIQASDIEDQSLTFSIASAPSSGTATITNEGELTYTPNGNYFGSDSIEITVQDSEQASSSKELAIVVNAVNDLPVVGNRRFSVDEDSTLSAKLTATDVEDTALNFSLVSSRQDDGNVTISSSGSFTFTPAQNFNGETVFVVQVNDQQQGTVQESITISVTPVQDAPVATDTSAVVAHASRQTGNLSASDVDGDSLSYSVVTDVQNGTLSLSADGAYVYQANDGFSGTDSFTYQVSDGQGNSSQASVTFNVQARPPEPAPADSGSGGGSLGYMLFALIALTINRRKQVA